jgi:hypothetical protein
MWKIFNLILSTVIVVAGIVTMVQIGGLLWQKRTPEVEEKFRHLVIRFGILVAIAVVMRVAMWAVRQAYFMGML